MKKKVALFGGGPHGKVVIDLMLHSEEFELCGVIDKSGEAPFGVPVIGTEDDMNAVKEMGISHVFVAVGNNTVRKKLSDMASAAGLESVNVIAPDSIISEYAELGKGVLVNHGAIVNAGASIGDGVILNTGCSVDHDCEIGEYCHIAPGVHISGSTRIGNETFLGTGASVIDRIEIGSGVMIGAGAAVVKDIPDGSTAVGVPARIVKQQRGKIDG